MQEKFEKNLRKVEEIIKELDNFNFEDIIKAKHKFNDGNRLLDECIDIINKKEFKLDEISLVTGKILSRDKQIKF